VPFGATQVDWRAGGFQALEFLGEETLSDGVGAGVLVARCHLGKDAEVAREAAGDVGGDGLLSSKPRPGTHKFSVGLWLGLRLRVGVLQIGALVPTGLLEHFGGVEVGEVFQGLAGGHGQGSIF